MSDVAVSDLKGGHAPAQKVGGMRVVTKPRVSESEKPVEKPKEEGEEVKTLVLVIGGRFEKCIRLDLHHTFACSCILHYLFQDITSLYRFLIRPCDQECCSSFIFNSRQLSDSPS